MQLICSAPCDFDSVSLPAILRSRLKSQSHVWQETEMLARFDGSQTPAYPPPRKNVMLLSCMDLRLIDDIVRFMNRDNLANRYDHFVLAGCALGAKKKKSWEEVFFQHLETACDLHDVQDVYILEHRHCGAYEKFLPEEGKFGDTLKEQARETACHGHYALNLADKITAWGAKHKRPLGVRCFLMDLRGDVVLLTRADDFTPETKKSRKKRHRH